MKEHGVLRVACVVMLAPLILASCERRICCDDPTKVAKHFISTYVTINGLETRMETSNDTIIIAVHGKVAHEYSESDYDTTEFLRYSRAKGDTAYNLKVFVYEGQGRTLGPDIKGVSVKTLTPYTSGTPEGSLLDGATISYWSFDDHIYNGYFGNGNHPPYPLYAFAHAVKRDMPLQVFTGVRLPMLLYSMDPIFQLRLSPPPTVRPARVRIELLLDSGKMHEVEVEIP